MIDRNSIKNYFKRFSNIIDVGNLFIGPGDDLNML